MPKLSSHQSATTTKMLLVGDSGSGKTGALASLAAAGYNLRIIDLDNGVDALANILRDPNSRYGREALDHIDYETITDKMKVTAGGQIIPHKTTVWKRTIGLLDNWKTATADFGPISSWTSNDILVIDSLTMLGKAAMNWVLAMNNMIGKHPRIQDYGSAQELVEGVLQTLYDENIVCNVIIIAHVMFIGEEGGTQRGYPAAIGSKLSPRIGRYFNTILGAQTRGKSRFIQTSAGGLIELKNTAPATVKAEYPQATGLADYFKAVREVGGLAPAIGPKALTYSPEETDGDAAASGEADPAAGTADASATE